MCYVFFSPGYYVHCSIQTLPSLWLLTLSQAVEDLPSLIQLS